jgi:hypothetical protein
VAARVKKIEEHQAEAHAMLIVYSFKEGPLLFGATQAPSSKQRYFRAP